MVELQDTLPELVARYLERALPAERTAATGIELEQTGRMWQKPGARALSFTAHQSISVEEVAFSWRAWFRPGLRVVDSFAAGEGQLAAKLVGLVPVMRQRGSETNKSEAMRYLAELPWAPHALVRNRALEWRQLDDQRVEVATRVGSARPAVQLVFDESGDIAGAYADSRPRSAGKLVVPTPWGGTFSDYAVVDGVRIPTRAEVRWELPTGPFVYFTCTVVGFRVIL